MVVLVVVLLIVAMALALAGTVTRAAYLRKHPVHPRSPWVQRLTLGLVVIAAATGIGIGFATSDHGITTGHVIAAAVIFAVIVLYALWRFAPAKSDDNK